MASTSASPWGLGRLLDRLWRRSTTSQTRDAVASSITWTIELASDIEIDQEAGAIYMSPLFGVGREDFRLVAAACHGPDPSLGLYLEHFPSTSTATVPSVECRFRWSTVSGGGEMSFSHTFENPLMSSSLVGKANLIPLAKSSSITTNGNSGNNDAFEQPFDLSVDATVTLQGVHCPGPTEREALEATAWGKLLQQVEKEWGVEEREGSQSKSDEREASTAEGMMIEVEHMRLFGSEEESN